MNKRGDIFNLYFIVFVIILCSVVIASYVNLQNEMKRVILSPEKLLKMEDELGALEYNEKIIMKSLIEDNLIKDPKTDLNLFCNKLEDYSGFFRRDSYYKDVEITEELLTPPSGSWLDLCSMMYNLSSDSNGNFVLKRDVLIKKFRIDNPNRKEKSLNFPVDVSFSYEKEYKFNSTSGEVVI